jgi:hypothetical protein
MGQDKYPTGCLHFVPKLVTCDFHPTPVPLSAACSSTKCRFHEIGNSRQLLFEVRLYSKILMQRQKLQTRNWCRGPELIVVNASHIHTTPSTCTFHKRKVPKFRHAFTGVYCIVARYVTFIENIGNVLNKSSTCRFWSLAVSCLDPLCQSHAWCRIDRILEVSAGIVSKGSIHNVLSRSDIIQYSQGQNLTY